MRHSKIRRLDIMILTCSQILDNIYHLINNNSFLHILVIVYLLYSTRCWVKVWSVAATLTWCWWKAKSHLLVNHFWCKLRHNIDEKLSFLNSDGDKICPSKRCPRSHKVSMPKWVPTIQILILRYSEIHVLFSKRFNFSLELFRICDHSSKIALYLKHTQH